MSESYIGIDVGGTKVAVAVLEGGELSHRGIQPTELGEADALVDEICSLVDSVRTESVRAVGIGVPSVVDFDAGRIRASVNIPLADLPLRDLLEERIGLPVFIDNDANVAALAEACSGGEIEVENLVMFTVGTGVGGGIVVNGRPYRGASGAAAELGHIMIGAELTAGAPRGGQVPAARVARVARRRPGARPARARRRRAASGLRARPARAPAGRGSTATTSSRPPQDGDEVAVGLLRILGERLGIGIANVINSFDPDVVAIGGGVSTAGELLLEPARRAAEAYVLPGVGTKTEIRLSRYGPTAGVLGAAILAKHELTRREEGP